jgi:hypothetical protein
MTSHEHESKKGIEFHFEIQMEGITNDTGRTLYGRPFKFAKLSNHTAPLAPLAVLRPVTPLTPMIFVGLMSPLQLTLSNISSIQVMYMERIV